MVIEQSGVQFGLKSNLNGHTAQVKFEITSMFSTKIA